MHYDRFLDKAR